MRTRTDLNRRASSLSIRGLGLALVLWVSAGHRAV